VKTSNPIKDRPHTVLRYCDQKKLFEADKMEDSKEQTQTTGVHGHK
jgi:hypothetical protein